MDAGSTICESGMNLPSYSNSTCAPWNYKLWILLSSRIDDWWFTLFKKYQIIYFVRHVYLFQWARYNMLFKWLLTIICSVSYKFESKDKESNLHIYWDWIQMNKRLMSHSKSILGMWHVPAFMCNIVCHSSCSTHRLQIASWHWLGRNAP